jgi:haloalkane dehalogenase
MGFEAVQSVRIGRVDVAYREVGTGSPLVLVHGWPLSSATWRKVAPALADTHRCIAVDLLGAGHTAAPSSEPLTIARQAEIVLGLADALGARRFALCGHDSGGSVARATAVAAPDRVTELVLADTEVPGHRPWQVVALQALGRLPGSAALLGRILGTRRLARSSLGFGPAFADLTHVDFDEFHRTLLAPLARSPEAVRGCHRFLQEFDFGDVDALRARYGVLRMPTLIVWGEQDRFFPIAAGRRLAALLPTPARFEPVPDAGLLVHEEQPEEWVRLVGGFLKPGAIGGSALG